jgi:hypothetical protein
VLQVAGKLGGGNRGFDLAQIEAIGLAWLAQLDRHAYPLPPIEIAMIF